MKKIFLLLFITTTLLSCGREPANKKEVISETEISNIEELTLLSKGEGLELLKNNCYTCHSPQSKSHDEMLAPPLAGIKYNYIKHYPNRTKFIARMSNFVHQPTKENAVMKGPVRRFGLMPKSGLELEEIQQISAFIYDNQLDIPNWFKEHFEEQHDKPWN